MIHIDEQTAASVLCNRSENCKPETDATPEVWRTLMAVYLGAIFLLSLGFNSTICLVFYKKSHLLSISNCFVLNLACCQLCMALLVLPFSLISVTSYNLTYTAPWCQLQGFFSTVVIVTLQLNLLVISIDRNYAIMNSLRYNGVFTQKLCTILSCGSWTVGVAMAIPPLLKLGMGEYVYQPHQFICALNWSSDPAYLIVFSILVFGFPILLESCCYVRIFIAAVSHTNRRSRVYPSISVTWTSSKITHDPTSDSSEHSDGTLSTVTKHKAAGCKAVRTIFLIAVFYSACWVPYFTRAALEAIYGVTLPHLSAASICLLYSSGILNPIIYVYLNRVIRREIGKFLCGITRHKDADDFGSTSMSGFGSSKQTTTTWSARQRARSKSIGGHVKDMGTIVEDPAEYSSINLPLEKAAVASTNMANKESPDGRLMQIERTTDDIKDVTVKSYGSSCSGFDVRESVKRSSSVNNRTACARDTCVVIDNAITQDLTKTTTDYKHNSVAENIESKNQIKNDMKETRPLKRIYLRSKSFAYLSKGKQRKRRDCGSFLYFENERHVVKEQQNPKDTEGCVEKKQRTGRYSLDHRVSMSSITNKLKFRLSMVNINEHVKKVTFRSNVSVNEQTSPDTITRPSFSRDSDSWCRRDSNSSSSGNIQTYSIIEVKPSSEGAAFDNSGSPCK